MVTLDDMCIFISIKNIKKYNHKKLFQLRAPQDLQNSGFFMTLPSLKE